MRVKLSMLSRSKANAVANDEMLLGGLLSAASPPDVRARLCLSGSHFFIDLAEAVASAKWRRNFTILESRRRKG